MNYSSMTVQKSFGDLIVNVEVLAGEEKRGELGEMVKVKESLVGNISAIQYISGKNWVDVPKNLSEILGEYKQLKEKAENAKTV